MIKQFLEPNSGIISSTNQGLVYNREKIKAQFNDQEKPNVIFRGGFASGRIVQNNIESYQFFDISRDDIIKKAYQYQQTQLLYIDNDLNIEIITLRDGIDNGIKSETILYEKINIDILKSIMTDFYQIFDKMDGKFTLDEKVIHTGKQSTYSSHHWENII